MERPQRGGCDGGKVKHVRGVDWEVRGSVAMAMRQNMSCEKDSWGARGINKLCNEGQSRCCCKGALVAPPTWQLADVAISNTDRLVLGRAFLTL